MSLGLALVCEESQVETLYVAADRAKGAATPVEFNTKGAGTLYFIRDVRDFSDGADPPLGTIIQGTINNIANATDDDSNTLMDFRDDSGTTDPIAEWDFGAAASRSIGIIVEIISQAFATWDLSYAIDPDGLGFGSFVNFVTSKTVLAKTRFKLFDSQTVFKLRIKAVNTNTSFRTLFVYEIFDLEKEHGTNQLSLEFFDQERSDWKSFKTFSTIDPFINNTNANAIDTGGSLPHKATGLVRAILTNIGKCNNSLIVIKANPCKT